MVESFVGVYIGLDDDGLGDGKDRVASGSRVGGGVVGSCIGCEVVGILVNGRLVGSVVVG